MHAAELGFEDDDQPLITNKVSASSDAPLYVPTPLARSNDMASTVSQQDGDGLQGRSSQLLGALEKLQEHEKLEAERNREKGKKALDELAEQARFELEAELECNRETPINEEARHGNLRIIAQSALNGKEIAVVNVDPGDMCSKVLNELANTLNLVMSDVCLLYNGEVLNPNQTIEDIGIPTDAIVLVILAPRYLEIQYGRLKASIVDVKNGNSLIRFDVGLGLVRCAAWAPDCRSVVIAVDFQATLRDCITRACVRTYRHADYVHSACFSNDGLHVLTASADGTAVLWETLTGSAKLTFIGTGKHLSHAEFSDEGKHVLTFYKNDDLDFGGEGTKQEWDIETGELLKTYDVSSEEVARSFKTLKERLSMNFPGPEV